MSRPSPGTVLLAFLVASIVARPACGGGGKAQEVRVSAASSLTDVITAIAKEFEQETGTKVRCNFASSSTLAQQIVQGAPCDVFLPADEGSAELVMNACTQSPPRRREFLRNRIVLLAREGIVEHFGGWVSSANLYSPRMQRLAMGDPSHVPAGMYAKRALENMQVWKDLEDRVIPTESVRAALALYQRGEVDAAIVYFSDAKAARLDGGCLSFSPELAPVVRYPMLVFGGRGGMGEAMERFAEDPRRWHVFHDAGFEYGERR